MERGVIRQQLLKILDPAPELKRIFLSSLPIGDKRTAIRRLLSETMDTTFEHDPTVPPLEWILTRDAIRSFRRILSTRSEQLARFSLLQYLDDLVQEESTAPIEAPTPAFWAELEHLLKGITGTTGVYSERIPAFTKYRGVKAARMRSEDLSRMARGVQGFLNRYACGLDREMVEARAANRSRILEYFRATDSDWQDWQWHTRHLIRDEETLGSLVVLTEAERSGTALARQHRMPFGITPYYVSLMDRESHGRDRAVRAQVIPTEIYVQKLADLKRSAEPSTDFMLERNTSPIEGITRRYPRVAILKPILTCPQICTYCQRNWEIQDVLSPSAVLPTDKLDDAIGWIAETQELTEILITGGEPLLLSDSKLEELLGRLCDIEHLERIRIGTRTPVTLPQRITQSLVDTIGRFHAPGRRELMVITHFEHTCEITPEALAAVQRIRRHGIEIYNQLVFTFHNSRKFEAAALRQKLRLIGVVPYYTFSTKGKEETDEFRAPIARLLQERKEEARLLPGTVRTDDYVFNVPGLGKNNLTYSQHHDLISILPDGRRVYEFHPWEKKLALADTYICTDVPIHDYLKRLEAAGENPADYKTIWYYY